MFRSGPVVVRADCLFHSTRRNGKDRDLWVMDPLEPASARMIAEVDGTWDALDWSVSDKEVLAQQLIAGSTETRLWRIDVESGRRVLVTPEGRQSGAVGGRHSSAPTVGRFTR